MARMSATVHSRRPPKKQEGEKNPDSLLQVDDEPLRRLILIGEFFELFSLETQSDWSYVDGHTSLHCLPYSLGSPSIHFSRASENGGTGVWCGCGTQRHTSVQKKKEEKKLPEYVTAQHYQQKACH